MSALLAIALLLLAIVVALSIWQRRGRVDHTATAQRPPTAAAPPVASVATADEPVSEGVGARRDDAEFGPLTWDGDMWACDRDVHIAGAAVSLDIAGGPRGPDDAHRAVARTLLASGVDIDARARPLVKAELQRRGCPPDDPVPYEASVGLSDEGRLAGWLWYCFGEFDGEIGVRSEDGWQTLHLEVWES